MIEEEFYKAIYKVRYRLTIRLKSHETIIKINNKVYRNNNFGRFFVVDILLYFYSIFNLIMMNKTKCKSFINSCDYFQMMIHVSYFIYFGKLNSYMFDHEKKKKKINYHLFNFRFFTYIYNIITKCLY